MVVFTLTPLAIFGRIELILAPKRDRELVEGGIVRPILTFKVAAGNRTPEVGSEQDKGLGERDEGIAQSHD